VAAASVVALALLTGCVSTAHESAESLETVAVERDQAAADLHEDQVLRIAGFLRERWGPVRLPEEPIVRWVAAPDWAPVISQCLAEEGFPGAQSADNGDRIDFSEVRAEGARELFLVDVAIYACQARYPVRAWYEARVAEIEAPWAWQYSTDVLVPCLLAAGHRPPALPAEDEFLAQWRSDDGWNPYAALAADPLLEQRARALCPPPEDLLDAAP